MAGARIGALRVDLGMNTAVFERGVGIAQRKINRFASNLQKTGAKMQGIGKKMSTSLTAPLVAVGAAFGKLTHDLARNAKEMQTSANVAGESFEEFQKQAHAAKTVGVEFEKLGDIFKDVRDRVGDFAATGGGPMADFFDNIAPKVGITQKAFEGLSGKDALQLYYNSLKKANVSQEEMVFYMETMASDATNLIPLLENNGKAMKELGENASIVDKDDAESLKRYTDAQVKMGQAVRSLTIALVDSGLLDAVTGLVEKVADWTKGLSETNPALLKVVVAIGAVVAVAGPLLALIGTLVTGFGAVVGALSPMLAVIATASAAGGPLVAMKVAAAGIAATLGPLLPVVAGFAAAGYLIYKNWDTIGPALEDFAVGLGVVDAALDENGKRLKASKSDWEKLGEGVVGFSGQMQSFADRFDAMNARNAESARKRNAQIIQSFTDFTEFMNSIPGKIADAFSRMTETMNAIGRNIMQGLVNGIKSKWNEVRTTVAALATNLPDWVKKPLDIRSPSRVFMGIGENIGQGLAIGIESTTGLVSSKMAALAQTAMDSASATIRQEAIEVRALLDRIFPKEARHLQFKAETALIDKSLGDGDLAEEAKRRLSNEFKDGAFGKISLSASTMEFADKPLEGLSKLETGIDSLTKKAEIQTVRIADSFADMARNTMNALSGLSDAIKGGGFLDILSGVLDLGLNLAGAGLFGSKAKSSVNSFGGFRADGGPVAFGKSYVVGERGPEIFTPGASGSITPNHAMGGGANVQVVPSPYFDVVVDGRVQRAAPAIAQGGAVMANEKASRMQRRVVR